MVVDLRQSTIISERKGSNGPNGIASLMHQCGVRKHHGHSVRSLTKAIFTLPFIGKNFFRGIVLNSQLPFCKNAAYQLLKGETYNRRRLLLGLGLRLFGVFNRLAGDERESVLIIDDNPILTLAADQLKQLGAFCEKTAAAFFDAIMDTALQCVGLSKNKLMIA